MSYIPFDNVKITSEVDIKEEKYQIDAFGRLRTSTATTLFESQLINGQQDQLWHTVINGQGVANYMVNQSALELSVSATDGDKVIRQGKIYTRARLGKSHLIFLNGSFNGGNIGVTKRIGYFDNDNGIFFQKKDNILSVVVRSKSTGVVTELDIPQTSWNTDKLDGTGESGITLNDTFEQVFVIDIEWFGTGKVRTGVMFDGKIIYVHQFNFSNTENKPFMTTATLPARFDIESDGTNSGTLKQSSVVIMTEGESNDISNLFNISNEVSPKEITNSLTHVISIRPKTTFQNTLNRINTILNDVELYASNNDVYFEIRRDCVLTNPFWNDVSIESSVEYDLSANDFSGGTVIMKGFLNGVRLLNKSERDDYLSHLITTNFDATSSTTLTLVAKTLNTISNDIFATIRWKENN